MIAEFIAIAWNNLRQRKIRSWLTMLGIFIGIASVVSLISLSQGMQDGINEQFRKLGSDKISVRAAGGNEGAGLDLSSAKITEDDGDSIRKVKGVDAVSGRLLKTGKVTFNRITRFTTIAGLNVEPEDIRILEGTGFTDVIEGRMLKTQDQYKVVVGHDFLDEDNIFKKPVQVGDVLTINDVDFDVVGILDKTGIFFVDAAIIMRKDVLRDLLGMVRKEESVIAVRIQPGADIDEVAFNIERRLRKTRDVEEGKEDFVVETPQQLLDTFFTVFNIVTGVVVGIAGISLLVGGIGIMNTMYTSVLERKREVGIVKAIGGRNSHVFLLFFIESGFLGMAGGVIGIILGLSLSKAVEVIAYISLGTTVVEASFSPVLIFGALAFSFIVGSLAGTLPAMQAARLHPVDALRRG